MACVIGLRVSTNELRNQRKDLEMSEPLDAVHHIAISVDNIAAAVEWYTKEFKCEIAYQDETWAFLKFANMHLALVLPNQHPPHIAFVSDKATVHPALKGHRDGTRSVYVSDTAGNAIELMDPTSL